MNLLASCWVEVVVVVAVEEGKAEEEEDDDEEEEIVFVSDVEPGIATPMS